MVNRDASKIIREPGNRPSLREESQGNIIRIRIGTRSVIAVAQYIKDIRIKTEDLAGGGLEALGYAGLGGQVEAGRGV